MVSDISLSKITATISEPGRAVAAAMQEHAEKAGYMPHVTRSDKKDDFYKVEYKKSKVKDPLYILHVNGEKWSLRCKLFHLDKYVDLLNQLSEAALNDILASRPCKGLAEGCTVGIEFAVGGKEYLLCRHGMHFRSITPADVPSVWALLHAESQYR